MKFENRKKGLFLMVLAFMFMLAMVACGNGDDNGDDPADGDDYEEVDNGDVDDNGDDDNGDDNGADDAESGDGLSGTLSIASFTNEGQVWSTAFEGANPGVTIDYEFITMEEGVYQEWLMPLLALGGDVPDIIFLEADFIRQFVETPFLRDLSHLLPDAEASNVFQFTLDAGYYEGEQRAFSWQATPGVFYYRRSMAERYLGTDDPAEVQEFFTDLESTLEAAQMIRDGSDGSSFLISNPNSFYRGFGANREDPWVVDNTLVIDPLMMEFVDFARTLEDEGLHAEIGQWTGEWFSSMNDEHHDAAGNPVQVFGYLLPTWGLTHVIMGNAPDTAGDWGIIESPLPYQWGGTWAAVTRDASNPELAEEFVRFVLDEDNQRRWADGSFTHEYLSAIDPTLDAAIYQSPGDLVSSQNVINAISDDFEGTPAYDFLGGQNPYETFGRLAPNVSLRLMQGTDAAIGDQWQDAVGAYVDGELGSVEELLASFRDAVSIILPDLNLE